MIPRTGSGSLIRVRWCPCWPKCQTDAREALGLGSDHRAKVVAAVGALLLQVGADGDQVDFVQCLASKARYVLLRPCR